ncbi:MAG: hybrid sensor histidine kinase/response regulator [Bacteroidia bacterium]|nr:hybrid sensor histidine kinase/response regulator [Bacteroidia bacterium]
MKSTPSRSAVKYIVIIGYVLVIATMIIGLWAIYRNLVDFSEKRIRNEDLTELIIVGNVINQLYEVESTQNLFTHENAEKYFERYNSIKPGITSRLDTLKQLSIDPNRVVKLDSIEFLLNEKEENLQAIFVLLDSIRKAPQILRQMTNTFVPGNVNAQIDNYLQNRDLSARQDTLDNVATMDTTVIKAEQRGFFRRIGDAIRGRQDSTVIIQRRPTITTIASNEDILLAIDTVVNMVRYSERLNLDNQQKFQAALLQRQSLMTTTNHLLTIRIDDLLKSIEQEEIDKSVKLIEAKDAILNESSRIVFWVSLLALAIALIFGLLFLVDFNKSQRYRRRLEESNVRINQLLQSREKLMLSISHDIKAPMSSVLGYIELIDSGADETSRKMYLENMKKSSEHILELVTNLLDYQKIESGTWSRKEMNFNVFELVENTVASFRPLAEKKNLAYHVFNKVPVDMLAFGDPFMIREIYTNLISNAIKYTPHGKVEVFVEPVNERNRTVLKFSVKDTGLGIDKQNQELIFDEFAQIKPEKIEHHAGGSGLGLAITKGLIDELDGKIYLKSEQGKGSEFFAEIPLETSKSAEVLSLTETYPDFDIENISVLAVDDDPIQLTMISEMLKLKKINVVTESNPENVLDVLKNNLFDLIFLDIQMPGINGFTLVKRILDADLLKSKSTPIIALSAKSDLASTDFNQSGFTDFLNKPFTSIQLFGLINKYLKLKLAAEKTASARMQGISALIAVVKDDKESSLEILKAFVADTEKNNFEMQRCFSKNDAENASHFAHKMLPLFKMMGDENLSDILLKLDRKQAVSNREKDEAVEKINHYVNEAKSRVSEIEKA